MKAWQKLEIIRKYGKVMVSHMRRVNIFQMIGDGNSYYQNINGDLILDNSLPEYISIRDFLTSTWCTSKLFMADINDFISPTGGYCEIRLDIGDRVYYGRAYCCHEDHYDKRVALEIAMGRLLKDPDLVIHQAEMVEKCLGSSVC